jgi:ribulose-phosphate 3-epimerase
MVKIYGSVLQKLVPLNEAVGRLSDVVDGFHVDVMDGRYNPRNTLNRMTPKLVEEMIRSGIPTEVHFMTINEIDIIQPYLFAELERVFLHIDSPGVESLIADITRQFPSIEVGLTLEPTTDIQMIIDVLTRVGGDCAQLMGVKTGYSGQQHIHQGSRFQQLRRSLPNLPISIDGGVNEKTAPYLRDIGCSILVSASYLFDPSSTMERQTAILRGTNGI